MEISGQAFLVSGGASGLGAACVRALLDEGANVVLADIASGGQADGDRLAVVRMDVTDEPEVEAAVAVARERFGGLRGVVNCAGISHPARMLGREGARPLESFTRTVDVNLVGTFNVIRLAAAAMAAGEPGADGERGAIVNTASAAAFEGQIGQAAYSASKGGVVAMTLPLARELAREGIRVNAIAPGIFDTAILAALSDEARASIASQVPFPPRLGRPEEFAQLAVHMIRNPMLNGEVVRLDGALRLAPR